MWRNSRPGTSGGTPSSGAPKRPDRAAREALHLLADQPARADMAEGLAEVRRKLSGGSAAPQRAALAIKDILEGQVTHVS